MLTTAPSTDDCHAVAQMETLRLMGVKTHARPHTLVHDAQEVPEFTLLTTVHLWGRCVDAPYHYTFGGGERQRKRVCM